MEPPLSRIDIPVPAHTCEQIFGAVFGFAKAHIVPADRAQPGDFLGLVLEVSKLTDKHIGYYHSYPIRRFIVMGQDGPETVPFEDLPEARKDLAARIAMEATVSNWSSDEYFKDAAASIEDEENGLEGSLYLLPDLGLLFQDNWEDQVYLDLDADDLEGTEDVLATVLCFLQKPAGSNHQAVEQAGPRARDLKVIEALIELKTNADEDNVVPLGMTPTPV